MRIYYGLNNNIIDVTNICTEKLKKDNIITIPYGDNNRDIYFTDPIFGKKKYIIIDNNGMLSRYDDTLQIKINLIDNTINTL